MNNDAARAMLLSVGPFVKGSAHGYPTRSMPLGKFGTGIFEHCHFCMEDYPYHREYCPWHDYFHDDCEMEVIK